MLYVKLIHAVPDEKGVTAHHGLSTDEFVCPTKTCLYESAGDVSLWKKRFFSRQDVQAYLHSLEYDPNYHLTLHILNSPEDSEKFPAHESMSEDCWVEAIFCVFKNENKDNEYEVLVSYDTRAYIVNASGKTLESLATTNHIV